LIRNLIALVLPLCLVSSLGVAQPPTPDAAAGGEAPEYAGWIGKEDDGKWILRDDATKKEYEVVPGKSTLEAGFDRVTAGKLPGQKAYAQLKGTVAAGGKGAQRLEVAEVVFLALQKPGGKATAVSVDRGDAPFGPLVATVDGKPVKVADEAQKAWLVGGGKYALYSARGTGGYEDEGQKLLKHDFTCTCKDKEMLAAPYRINAVTEVETDARPVALVEMSDGGLGIGHVAVVDYMKNRAILKRDGAKVVKVDGQKVDVAYYEGEAAWNAVNEGKQATPTKTETLDLGHAVRVPAVGI
jgi:hypothetical protein